MSEETDNTDLEYNADLQIQYKTAIKKYLLQCIIMEGSKIILFFIILSISIEITDEDATEAASIVNIIFPVSY